MNVPVVGRDLTPEAFRTMFDALTIPLLLVGGDGTILRAGGSVARDFGFAVDEIVGRNVVEFIPPDQVGRAVESLVDLMRHNELGIGVPTVFAIVRADGGLTWSAVAAVPFFDDPDINGILLYLLPWDAQLHFDQCLSALLAGEPLPVVLSELARSIAASLEAAGAVIHHGYDGADFSAATGTGVPDACRDLAGAPWHEAATSGRRRYVATRDLPEAAAGAARAAGLEGCWAIPLPPSPDLAPAVLTVWRTVPEVPVTAHEFMIVRSLRYVQLVLVRWADHQQLAHLASHDALTGTANRVLFNQRLSHALESHRGTAVLFCDLDGFKTVNDTHGHGAGDALLVEVAGRLRSALRTGDELARIGGDEFTVLLHEVVDPEAAREVADRLVASMREPFVIGEATVTLGLSVGIALAHPGGTADSMLSQADAALYQAKREGGGVVRTAAGVGPTLW